MSFQDREGAIICNRIDRKIDVVERKLSTGSIKILIGVEKLRSAICACHGVKENENRKNEKTEGGGIKITPISELHKGEEFLIKGNPPRFKRADGMQLIMTDPKKDKHYLFKNHFCWGKQVDFKNHYEFCKRTGK
jgi:hypothetical protein